MVDIAYPKTNVNINDISQRDIPFQPNTSGLHKPFFSIMADKGPVNEIVSGNAAYLSYVFGNGIFDPNSKTFNHSNIFLMEALENNVAYVVRVASENIKTANIAIYARYRAVFDNIQNDDLSDDPDDLLNDFNYPIKGRVIEVEWKARSFDGALNNLADGYFEDRNTAVPETSSTPLTAYNVTAAERISNKSPLDESKGFSQWMPILGLEADSPGPSGNDYGFSIYPTNEAEDTITRDNLERIAFRFIARQKNDRDRYNVRININNDNSALVSLSDLALDKTTNTDYSIRNRIETLYQTEVDGRAVSNFETSFKTLPMNIRRLQNIIKTSGFAIGSKENWYHQTNPTGDKLYYTGTVDENTSQLYHEYEDTNVLNEAVYDNIYLGSDDKNIVAPYYNNTKVSLSHIFSDYIGDSAYHMVNENGKKLYKRGEEDNHTFYDVIPYGLDESNNIQYAKAFVDIEGDPEKIIKYSDKNYGIEEILNTLLSYLRTTTDITNGVAIVGAVGSTNPGHLANIVAFRTAVTASFVDGFDHAKLINDFSTEITSVYSDDLTPDPAYTTGVANAAALATKTVDKIKEGRVKAFLDLFRIDGKLKEYEADGTLVTNKIPDHLVDVLIGQLALASGASNFTYLENYNTGFEEIDYSNHFSHKSVLVVRKSIVDNDAYTGTNFAALKNIPSTDDLDHERYTNNPEDWVYFYVPKSLLGYKNPYDIFQYNTNVEFSNDFRTSISKNIKIKSQKYTSRINDLGNTEFIEPSPKYVTLNNVDLYESKTIANNLGKHTIQTTDYNETNSEYSDAGDEDSNNGINNIDGSGRKKLRLVTCTLTNGTTRVVKHRDSDGQIVVNSEGQYGLEQYNSDGSVVVDGSGDPILLYGKGKTYIQLKQITPNSTVVEYSKDNQNNKISLNYPVLSLYKNVDFYNFDGKNHAIPRRQLDRSVRWDGWIETGGEPVPSQVITKTTVDGETFVNVSATLDRSITRERDYLRLTYIDDEPTYTDQERTRKTTTDTTIERLLTDGRTETVKLSPVQVSESDPSYDPYNPVTNVDGKHYDATSESRNIVSNDHISELSSIETDKIDTFNALTPRGRSRYTYTRTKFLSDNDDNYTPTSLFSNNKNITLKGGRVDTTLTLAEEDEKENYFVEFEEYVKNYLINDLDILQKQRFPITHIYDSGFTDATKQACIGMISRRDDVKVELVTQIVHHFEYDGSTPINYLSPNRANTMSQDIQIGASLSDRVRLNPESQLYGTNACRASVWGQAGKSSSSLLLSWKSPVPVALARMNFRGKFDGSFRVSGEPVGVPDSRISGFDSIAWTPPALNVIEREIVKSSLNVVDFYDKDNMHYRDYRSVYTEGNSVLLDDIVMDRIIYTIKIARDIYFKNMVGSRERNIDLYQSLSSIFSNEITRAFDTRLEASMTFRQTEVEKAYGDRHTLDLQLRFPIPARVLNLVIHADRYEGE